MMNTSTSKFLFLFFLSILIVCTGGFLSTVKSFKQLKRQEHKLSHRALIKTIQRDLINPPITTYPTTPITNPATTPVPVTATPDTSTPAIVTAPSVNPITITPITPNPVVNPVNNPPVPITNPVTTFPGGQPMGNPVTTYPTPAGSVPVTAPVVVPPVTTNAPAVPGQSWCVARGGVPESAVQAALDYACGLGGADCATIQQGASCYNPNTMQNHASYAFNSYYQRNPVQTSCDFGGTAFITNVNPSSGSCIYPIWSSTSTSPATTSPITTFPTPTTNPTPTTASSSGATPASTSTPPTFLNPTNPALGGATTGFGLNPNPITNTSSISSSNGLRPYIGCIIMVTSIVTGKLVLH